MTFAKEKLNRMNHSSTEIEILLECFAKRLDISVQITSPFNVGKIFTKKNVTKLIATEGPPCQRQIRQICEVPYSCLPLSYYYLAMYCHIPLYI